ncbi:ribonuclease H-like domain-containing protein [Aspergillus pseudoustus]|uniref:Ribonuclease H-like domain-containing protein n=1 Tax=Aspergillus pseudoustus TaxID=1810923 RepID=A0ABR4JNT1_9EURO
MPSIKPIPIPQEDHATILEALSTKCHSTGTLARFRFPIGPSTAPPPLPSPPAHPNGQGQPQNQARGPKRHAALAIDCEMVGIDPKNTSYLGQVVAVDMLTGKTVLDICVQPPVTVRNWRSTKSGLSPAVFREYKKRGRLVQGVPGAQRALYALMDGETILVGHALENDIRALGIVHGRVVDTQILTREIVAQAAGGLMLPCRTWGLKTCAEEILGRGIQQGREGHGCEEDTRATRDLALACVRDADFNPHGLSVREWAAIEAQCEVNFPAKQWGGYHSPLWNGDGQAGTVDYDWL